MYVASLSHGADRPPPATQTETRAELTFFRRSTLIRATLASSFDRMGAFKWPFPRGRKQKQAPQPNSEQPLLSIISHQRGEAAGAAGRMSSSKRLLLSSTNEKIFQRWMEKRTDRQWRPTRSTANGKQAARPPHRFYGAYSRQNFGIIATATVSEYSIQQCGKEGHSGRATPCSFSFPR